MVIKTKSPQETYDLGIKLGKILKSGDIISLNGDLGAGKTQLVKGIAESLSVKDYITSPTFTLVNEYYGEIPLYHFDVYRINEVEELYEIGFDEYIYGKGICVIEWGDIIKDILPDDIIHIDIKKIDESMREIKIDSNMKNLEELL